MIPMTRQTVERQLELNRARGDEDEDNKVKTDELPRTIEWDL